MKKLLILFGIILIVALLAISQRHRLLISVLSSSEPPPPTAAAEESVNSYWFDDYFLIEAIDSNTYAIGEPLYAQQNFSYLIVGSERAILFDAGPGYEDIRAAAESLTELPITFIPSHFHYDHVGNRITFEKVAAVDLPYLRDRAPDNKLTLTWTEHLGSSEGIEAPTLTVDEWLPINSIIDLGNRQLRVLYTPGHTEDSISLLDMSSGTIFTGDFIYPGPLYAFLPNSGMSDYLLGADAVIAAVPGNAELLGAHRVSAPGLPRLSMTDVHDLRATLMAIKEGSVTATGFYPREYPINEQMTLLAEPGWLQDWTTGLTQ